ncbi:RadC family protein [Olavius algarvensis spirochete endosymbiont]|uniref:RadC family protein n=1 Tax=Olavius algarvensis spirochete endosymbiont TaxID=260710 RepID=UPI000F51A8B9|nr:DNA repair protein RadC [Olavius algarvensis spirochete endosymbiont]
MKTFAYKDIADMPVNERPRERFAARGVNVLSDVELLALMLGSGSGKKNVNRLAVELLRVVENSGDDVNLDDLVAINGIGLARAAMISASLEFARRRLRPARRKIGQPSDVIPLLTHWADRPQEHFLVLSLNGAHEVIRIRVISQGILDRTVVHPREVFVDPLRDRAAAIVCAHNHPSGNKDPSSEDKKLTKQLRQSGDLLGIPLLDHIIFTEEGYFSFLESGIV